MTWLEASEAARNAAQAAVVVVGGGWAYLKYFRGRTFSLRGELAVNAEGLSLSNAQAVRAVV